MVGTGLNIFGPLLDMLIDVRGRETVRLGPLDLRVVEALLLIRLLGDFLLEGSILLLE